MPFLIVRNDITKMSVDAVVNTTQRTVGFGPGVDADIYKAAGKDALLNKRSEIGVIEPGSAAITPGFKLAAKYIIHTVATSYKGGNEGEEECIRNCYKSVFKVAEENNVGSLAIPLLASGNLGFPKGIAIRIALSEIESYLKTSDITVYLVVYDAKSYSISEELYGDIDSYINDNYIEEKKKSFLRMDFIPAPRQERMAARSLDDVIKNLDKTFMELVFTFADEKGLSDVEVQKRANLDRKAFSKLKCGTTKNPSKQTALALSIALCLSLDETKDLLSRAGFALSPCCRQDLIVQYFIERQAYDIYAVNMALFEHGEQLLGSQTM